MSSDYKKIEMDWLPRSNKRAYVKVLSENQQLVNPSEGPPDFSIVVANYNRGYNLPALIESVRNQQYGGSIELIIVDDCSTDDSIETAMSIPGINVVQLQNNSGSEALPQNVGVYYAKGKKVGFIDSDDYLLRSDAVDKMSQALDQEPKALMAVSNVVFQAETPELPTDMRWIKENPVYTPSNGAVVRHANDTTTFYKRKAKDWSIFDLMVHGYHIGFRVMRPKAIREVGGWPIELGKDDDMGLLLRLAAFQYKDSKRRIIPVDTDAYAYRITGDSASVNQDENREALEDEVLRVAKSLWTTKSEFLRECPEDHELLGRWNLPEW